MIKKNIEELLNEQMNFEFSSAYIYRAMGAYCDSIDMAGFANWFKIQAKEEETHFEKFYNFITERGGRAFFTKMDAPQKEWKSLIAAFESGYEHEQIVTEKINNIMTLAIEEKDHATMSFLNWFVDEQVEEESMFDLKIKQLKLIGGSGHGLFMMDKEMGSRVFIDTNQQ